MWIARDSEALIRQFSKQFPAVFVTGARQVGKTSILIHLFPENSYVTLDDPDKAAFAENAPSDFLHSLAY
ncbi:MAG TPA: AAA family ATPase, partial [Candidatus Brocadiaceae bacterium]|nr:AAA family ATPase [Candidatus Brocadiaceae bacterium]